VIFNLTFFWRFPEIAFLDISLPHHNGFSPSCNRMILSAFFEALSSSLLVFQRLAERGPDQVFSLDEATGRPFLLSHAFSPNGIRPSLDFGVQSPVSRRSYGFLQTSFEKRFRLFSFCEPGLFFRRSPPTIPLSEVTFPTSRISASSYFRTLFNHLLPLII